MQLVTTHALLGRTKQVDSLKPPIERNVAPLENRSDCHRELLAAGSEEGERIVERLLSASITCRLQKRSLFTYLTDVLTAKIRGDPIPLLA